MNVSSNIILRNAQVYAPDHLGRQDVLVSGGRVSAISSRLPTLPNEIPHEDLDLDGLLLVPGLVDAHVHTSGGGGEGGPETRVPPMALSQFTRAGITTCVGVLGTDGTTRTVRDLVATTLGLRALGLSAYCYTGSYQLPVTTLTGSIRDDIVFIEPIIGVGELAISDHRSSQPTLNEFLRVASDAYTAGLMSGKAGVLHIHLGDGARGFELINRALDTAEIPARVYHPTHINRRPELFEQAGPLAARGVTVDVTAFPTADGGFLAEDAIGQWLDSGFDSSKITCSSDGAGCMPIFDEDGGLAAMDIGRVDVLAKTLRALLAEGRPMEQILPIFTRNVADVLRMPQKGRIRVGLDADLVVMDAQGVIRHVMCAGQWMVSDERPVRLGLFENN